MTPEEIAIKAIKILNDRITDEIFLIIQHDGNLMREYLRAVENIGLDKVNQTIGKMVKESYRLENSNRDFKPKSTLIKSFQKHKNAYTLWTKQEDYKLEQLFCEGVKIKKLAEIFERNEGAIRSRIKKLELNEKYR